MVVLVPKAMLKAVLATQRCALAYALLLNTTVYLMVPVLKSALFTRKLTLFPK